MSNHRVIVFGTTVDYIAMINRQYPGRCLFVTDPLERARSRGIAPDNRSELLCDLENFSEITATLENYLKVTDGSFSGIVAFDDESMLQASRLAQYFNLEYPSPETVLACRNKYRTKDMWNRAGVSCPETAMVENPAEAVKFIGRLNRPVVIKPLTGSGSELTFYCEDKFDCMRAFVMTREHLIAHPNIRMYRPGNSNGENPSPREVFAMECYIPGREYSCDFIIDGDDVRIIRTARKIHASEQAFGTTLAYIVPSELPGALNLTGFRGQLRMAAQAVGINRAVCMIDFIVHNDRPYFLEIAPRPGGDCLPFLIKQSGNLDILGLTLDVAEGTRVEIPPPDKWKKLVGLRLIATKEGVIERLEDTELRKDPRVQEIYYKHQKGHHVILPPDDYDSRMLGHVVFAPVTSNIEKECRELSRKLIIHMEAPKWKTAMGS